MFRAYRGRVKEEKMGVLMERIYWIDKVVERWKENLSVGRW